MFGVSVLLRSEEQPGPAEKPKAGSAPRPLRVGPAAPRPRPTCGEKVPGALMAINLRGEFAERRGSPESCPCQSGAEKEQQNTGYHGRLAKQVLKNWEERELVSFSEFQE